MDAKLGTAWVAPREGAKVLALKDRIALEADWMGDRLAQDALLHLSALDNEHKTNLALTGSPLTDYDLKRIAACE